MGLCAKKVGSMEMGDYRWKGCACGVWKLESLGCGVKSRRGCEQGYQWKVVIKTESKLEESGQGPDWVGRWS